MTKRILTLLLAVTAITALAARRIAFPFPILGGELSNSAATSVADIDSVIPRMAQMGLNTVLVPAYWELMEPTEGQFDFTLIDRTIERAREHRLKVVFLWFGAWKNSMSCYTPEWFKRDTERFPRAQTASGKPLEIASCFSDNVLQADLRAFTRLMEHIKAADPQGDVVIMMQIENEIGMLESARDHAPLAEQVYRCDRWAERYGTTAEADERFMARYYAKYVEHLAKAARRICPQMPLYVNAAMNSRGRKPGEYPSAGPLAHLKDEWKKYAPTVDLMAPDIYDTGFKSWAAQYDFDGNRLFIPETRCSENSGVRALYSFGEHHALGFSPFAIDQADKKSAESVSLAYDMLRKIYPLTSHPSPLTTKTWGLLFDQTDRERVINDGDVVLTCGHYFTLPWDPRATDGSTWPEGGAIVLKVADHDYLIAGQGVVVDFKTVSEKEQEVQQRLGEDGFVDAGGNTQQQGNKAFHGRRIGLLAVDQVDIGADGQLVYIRRDNGDQSHQGRHARISVGEWKILHVTLYDY